jgi:acyl-CoA thioester hydrolase
MSNKPSPAPGLNSQEFNWSVRVYYEDTDAAGLVYHSNYLKYMERARTEWLRAYGYSQETLRHNFTLIFVVKDMTIRFHQPAKLDDLLNINARIKECRGASLLFQQAIVNEQSTPLCDAEVNVVCLDAGTLKPRRLPEPLKKELNLDH